MTPTEVLEAAKQKIEQGWCQGRYEDANGNVCASGAFNEDTPSQQWVAARRWLQVAIGTDQLIAWNDAKGRTKEEVLAAFDKAIELSKAQA